MFVKDDFSAGAPISQVPASWFNRVAKFLNALIPGTGIAFNKADDGTPVDVRVRVGNGLGIDSNNDLCISPGDTAKDYGDFVTDETCTEHEYCRKLTINWPRFDENGLFVGYSTDSVGTQTVIHYTPGGDSE